METDPWKVVNDAWLKRYTWATGVIAAFTIVIAGASIQQCRMYKASERPWIGHTKQVVTFDKEKGKVMNIQWHYTNGGKAPALNLRFELTMKIGKPLKEDVKAMEAPSVERCHGEQPLPGIGGYLAVPGADQIYIVEASPDVLDSSESITANRVGLYLVGCVDYEDTSGGSHRTNVCQWYAPAAHIFLACPESNASY